MSTAENPGTWMFAFVAFIVGGWALGDLAPLFGIALGGVMFLAGLASLATRNILIGLFGLIVAFLGIVTMAFGYHLHQVGFGT